MLRSIQYVAEFCGLSEDQIRNLIDRGDLEAVNMGTGRQRRRLKISDEALRQFIQGRTVQPRQSAIKRKRPAPKPQREWV